jgi:hypothetical protein
MYGSVFELQVSQLFMFFFFDKTQLFMLKSEILTIKHIFSITNVIWTTKDVGSATFFCF